MSNETEPPDASQGIQLAGAPSVQQNISSSGRIGGAVVEGDAALLSAYAVLAMMLVESGNIDLAELRKRLTASADLYKRDNWDYAENYLRLILKELPEPKK